MRGSGFSALAIVALSICVACGSPDEDKRIEGDSLCGAEDVFLLGVEGDAARVVCYRADGSFERFGPEIPRSVIEAEAATLLANARGTRVVVADSDTVLAGGGADWWPLHEGAHRLEDLRASDGLELVRAAPLVPQEGGSSVLRHDVLSFEGERLFRGRTSSMEVSLARDGSYFLVDDLCELSVHPIRGDVATLVEHVNCGDVERARIVETFASSVLLAEDYELRFRDLRGDALAVEGLDRIDSHSSARNHIVEGEIVGVGDRALSTLLPLAPDIDAFRVHAVVPERYALVGGAVEDMPRLSLVGPDGDQLAAHDPDHEGYDTWVSLYPLDANVKDDRGFLLYLLTLGGGGAIPAEEVAVDLLRFDLDGSLVSQRLSRSNSWPTSQYLFADGHDSLLRLDDGVLYQTDLATMEESEVEAPHALTAWSGSTRR